MIQVQRLKGQAIFRRGQIDVANTRVARVSQKLDDGILDTADVMTGLPAFCLGHPEAHVAPTEVLLHPKRALLPCGGYEINQLGYIGHLGSPTLLCDVDSARLADDDDAHLTGILHLALDLPGDVVGKDCGRRIGYPLGLDHDVQLAASLHRDRKAHV